MSLALVAGIVMVKGRVSGREFAPSHFQTRQFSFYEIPFLHVQITPIERKNTTGPVSRQLKAKGWIQVPRGKKPTDWHLVSLQRGIGGTPAVAGLLIDELELQYSGSAFWKTWNTDNPKRASVLWPAVQRLAERELYVMIPELMQLARTLPGDDDKAKLSAAIDSWLISQYAGLVVDLREAERDRLAEEILTEAIADYPDSQLLIDLRPADG